MVTQLRNGKKFLNKAIKLYGNKYDYSSVIYEDSKTKVNIICTVHKITFEQTPSSHLKFEGCGECLTLKRSATMTKIMSDKLKNDSKMIKELEEYKQNFINKANKIYGNDKYDYSLMIYKSNKTKIIIICKIHNERFEQSPQKHIRGEGCKKCAIDKIEKIHKIDNTTTVEDLNSDKMQICRACHIELPLIHFLSLETIDFTLCRSCIDCRNKFLIVVNKRIEKHKQIYDVFKQNPCVDCGCKVSRSIEEYEIEIKKCVPRCRMCHHLKTQTNNILSKPMDEIMNIKDKKAKTIANAYKNTLKHNIKCDYEGCNNICTEGKESCFDWDHIDQDTKYKQVSQLYSKSSVHEEIEKCRLLCSNCHLLWTNIQKQIFTKNRQDFIVNHLR